MTITNNATTSQDRKDKSAVGDRLEALLAHQQRLLPQACQAQRFRGAMIAEQRVDVRLNRLLPAARTFADDLRSLCEPVPWCDDALRLPPDLAAIVSHSLEFRLGALYLQAKATTLAVRALDPRPGELVLDLAAAPGGKATQIATAMGCRAVGIAGGAEKCCLVTEEFNFDACLDYKSGDLGGQIKDAAPDGIDIYFDNGGGEMLDMVLALMNAKGRIPVCGVLSQYNAEDEYYGVTNTRLIFDKQLRLQGFLNSEFHDQWDRDRAELENLVASGKLKYRETVAQGLKRAPQAFIGML